VAFLNTEIDLSLTLASLASTDRRLGYVQTAERCSTMAWRGYRTALYWLQRSELDDRETQTLRERVDNLHQALKELENDHPVPELWPMWNEASTSRQKSEFDKLTPREEQVLRLLVEGNSTKQIAAKLSIAFKTAACHRSRIMSKLGTQKAAALVRQAIKLGLVEL
jgi:DNA-binding CsgD family transcriptional regulator